MKNLLIIVICIFTILNSFGQEPGHNIEFVFVDSTGAIITPAIWVKSKQINHHSSSVIESEIYQLKIDSLNKDKYGNQYGTIRFNNYVYTIPPIAGGHWIDSEYDIKLSLNNQVMNMNFITSGFSLIDTIVFKVGNFSYLHKDLCFGLMTGLKKSKLIKLESKKSNTFCSLNCAGNIVDLDSNTRNLILKTSKSSFPEFFVVNNFPLGILIWNLDEDKVSICYFSDDYIELIKKNYY
jgi:hypothetical protein